MATETLLPELDTKEATETWLEEEWILVVYDDPVNLMEYVVMVFEDVLRMNHEEAERHMWEVHHTGESAVWKGSREPGEVFLQQLHYRGLTAQLRKAFSHD